MRSIVALGGKALLKRGEAVTGENQRKNVGFARDFVRQTGKPALIGSLVGTEAMLHGDAGTFVSKEFDGIVYRDQVDRGDT